MVQRARVLHQHGFAILLFDLQAHGESSGGRITFGRLEGLDAAAAVRFVRGRLPGERVGVIGVSLGGAAAVLGPESLRVDALVLESVYPSIDAALANRLRAGLGSVAGPLLTPLLAPAFKLLLPPVLGVTPAELRPVDRIREVRAPVLVASGDADDRTTPGRCSSTRRSRSASGRSREPGTSTWSVSTLTHTGATSCRS